MSQILKEAKRLYGLGWAVHWIRPKSKAPVKAGWSSGARDSWAELEGSYRAGYGLGVRLGEASRLPGGGYLAVVDIDVKSASPRHHEEAVACVERVFPGLYGGGAPIVFTGRGNGSAHVYVKTSLPVQSGKLGSSGESVEVLSPTSPISKSQKELLSAEKLAQGVRLKKAWEVELMSAGKQVVLPPTVHADTGNLYRWNEDDGRFNKARELPEIAPPKNLRSLGLGEARGKGDERARRVFQPVSVDLVGSSLSDRLVGMIISGDGVSDRSAALMSVALGMVSQGFSDDEILSVLTDRDNFLGEVAYEHRNTESRQSAARWVKDYTLAKARRETSAAEVFAREVVVTEQLSDEEAEKQAAELIGNGDAHWKDRLDRGKGAHGMPGPLRPTLKNVLAILEHSVGRAIFKRDAFAMRDTYAQATPWGGKFGALVTDDDAIAIKVWLSKKWKFEPTTNTIYEAITHILANNSYHPVRDYLGKLPPWDGVPRVDTWLRDCLGAVGPEPYVGDVSRKVLVAAIARIYEPGCKFDHMLILEGKQGIGKSSIGRIMAGEDWFLDGLPDLADKDAALGLLGNWFVEMPELANLKRSEVETVKAFVTRQTDKVRPPYGRRVVELKRQCVFFGSTNASFYLVDKTGNRRFWPVHVTTSLDFERLAGERDQLFAEAKWIWENLREPLYLDNPKSRVQAEVAQEDKVSEDEETVIADILTHAVADAEGKDVAEVFDFSTFKLTDLFNGPFGPLSGLKQDAFRLQAVGRALKRLGFDRFHTRTGKRWGKKPAEGERS